MTRSDAPRPRLLHVMDSLGTGGVELNLLHLIRQTRGQFEHSICCLRDLGSQADRFVASGARVTLLEKPTGHDWSLLLRLARLCRQLRPHVMHSRNWGTIEAVPAARLAGVPAVVHSEHGRESAGALADPQRDRIRRLVFLAADRVVAVSEHLRVWLREDVKVAPRKLRLIANGVDTDHFRPCTERRQLRQQHGYEDSDLVVGALSRLQPVKDYPRLIDAFAALRKERPNAKLLIVGDGSEHAALAEQVRNYNLQASARLVGQQDDVRDWLVCMDVFVHPSLMEGLSNSLLQAMSIGLAVVAARVGGNPELIEESINGKLVGARDGDALREAISSYLDDPDLRIRHGAAARHKVATCYSSSAMIRGYTNLYDEVLRRTKLRRVEIAASGVS